MKFPLAISIFIFVIFGIIVSILSINFENHTVLARCPNGTHKSPSGDCEKYVPHKGLPRCPNGAIEVLTEADCEKVSGGDSLPLPENNDNNKHGSKSNDKGSSKSNNNEDSSSTEGSTLQKMIRLTQGTQIP